MAAANTKQTLIEFLVASQLELVERREQTLKTLPHSAEYFEKAASLRSEITASRSRADRLNRMIDPIRKSSEADVDQDVAA